MVRTFLCKEIYIKVPSGLNELYKATQNVLCLEQRVTPKVYIGRLECDTTAIPTLRASASPASPGIYLSHFRHYIILMYLIAGLITLLRTKCWINTHILTLTEKMGVLTITNNGRTFDAA